MNINFDIIKFVAILILIQNVIGIERFNGVENFKLIDFGDKIVHIH